MTKYQCIHDKYIFTADHPIFSDMTDSSRRPIGSAVTSQNRTKYRAHHNFHPTRPSGRASGRMIGYVCARLYILCLTNKGFSISLVTSEIEQPSAHLHKRHHKKSHIAPRVDPKMQDC